MGICGFRKGFNELKSNSMRILLCFLLSADTVESLKVSSSKSFSKRNGGGNLRYFPKNDNSGSSWFPVVSTHSHNA